MPKGAGPPQYRLYGAVRQSERLTTRPRYHHPGWHYRASQGPYGAAGRVMTMRVLGTVWRRYRMRRGLWGLHMGPRHWWSAGPAGSMTPYGCYAGRG